MSKYLYLGDGEGPFEVPYFEKEIDWFMAYDHLDIKEKINHLYFSYIGFSFASKLCI